MKTVTARMVAAAAGVSLTTVSRVINNDPGVEDETRRQVLATARRLGYQMRSRGGRWGIGLILERGPYSLSGYFAEMLAAVSREISRRNCRTELVWKDELDLLNERVIAGGIDLCSEMAEFADLWREKFTLPLVRINSPSRRLDGIGSVIVDSSRCYREVTERLWALGHRKIYYLSFEGEEAESGKLSRRFLGFLETLGKLGIARPMEYALFLKPDCSQEEVTATIRYAAACGGTALLSPTDLFAIRIDPSLRELGIRVPRDLSLVTGEFCGVSAFLDPPRSTVALDYAKLAATALDHFETILRTGAVPPDAVVHSHLVERSSIAPPGQGIRTKG